MEKITKIALISIGAGLLLCLLSYILIGGNWTRLNSKGNEYVSKTYESATDISQINIDETANSVRFVSADTDKITIDYYDNPDRSLYEISEDNGELTFERNSVSAFKLINIDFTERHITITVPSGYAGGIDVDMTSGSFKADDIQASQISLENTSGSIKLNNVSVAGPLDIENTSGSIKFENLKAGGDISIENTSGSIKGTINGKKSDYTVTSETTMGSSNLENSSGGKYKLDIETTAGSVDVTFTE